MSNALAVYLNDHLSGATLGVDHARELQATLEDTAHGLDMARVADAIAEDRDTLVDLIDRAGISRNPVKQATAWVAEKAGRVKFSGLSSGDRDLGTYLALETMSLGVAGKQSLWEGLRQVAGSHEVLAEVDLDELIARAREQREFLEDLRLTFARLAFGPQSLARESS